MSLIDGAIGTVTLRTVQPEPVLMIEQADRRISISLTVLKQSPEIAVFDDMIEITASNGTLRYVVEGWASGALRARLFSSTVAGIRP